MGEFPGDTQTTAAPSSVDRSIWAAIVDGYRRARAIVYPVFRQLRAAHVQEPDEAGKARLVSVAYQLAAARAEVKGAEPRHECVLRAMCAAFVLWMRRHDRPAIVNARHPLAWAADERDVVALLEYGLEAFQRAHEIGGERDDGPRDDEQRDEQERVDIAAAAAEFLGRKAVGA